MRARILTLRMGYWARAVYMLSTRSVEASGKVMEALF
jgi:hypothetical protein